MAAAMRVVLAKLDQAIREAGRSVNFRPVLDHVRLDVIAETRKNFDQGRSPDGAPWVPLKWPRPNSKGNDQPLRDLGLLMASVTAPGASGNVDVADENHIEWGTNFEHAAIHQYGGIITPKTAKVLAIPATMEAKRAGSPRNFAAGRLEFRFGRRGGGRGAGVAVEKVGGGRGKSVREIVHYYFAKSVTIPKRPFLGITEGQANEYAEMAGEFAAEEMAKRIGDAGGAE